MCIVSKEGRNGGTFAHELIAVEYAGWISPKFRILVNQTFIAYRTGKLQPQQPQVSDPTPRLMSETFNAVIRELDSVKRDHAEMRDRLEKVVYAVKSEVKKRKRIERELSKIRTATEYFTTIGYVNYACGYHADYLPLEEAQRMWRMAVRYCKTNNIKRWSTPDQRFGRVKTYPFDVLFNLFHSPNMIH